MPRIGFGLAVWLRDDHAENVHRALDELALAGFDGVEFNPVERWYLRPQEFKRWIQLHGLEVSSSYMGFGYLDPARAESEYQAAQRRIEFLNAIEMGVLLIDGGRPVPSPEKMEDAIQTIARTANRIGKYAKERGVTCCWHQHWGTIFENQAPFHRFMELTDPDLVKFCPDTAQLAMGDFDVYETLERYKHRIGFVHFKDLDVNRNFERTAQHGGPSQPSDSGAYGIDSKWRFVELGRGIIDFSRAWRILQSAGYDGWIVDDFDYAAYPAYQSALACRKYLKEALGV
jgi:inosose dehydratase